MSTFSVIWPLFILLQLALHYRDGFQLTAAFYGVLQKVARKGDPRTVLVLLLVVCIQLLWMGVLVLAISGVHTLNGDRQGTDQRLVLTNNVTSTREVNSTLKR